MIKRTLMLLLAGLGVGLVLTMWFGPGLISWWNRPSVATPISCDSAIREVTRDLVNMQLQVGAALGLVFAVAGNLLAHRRSKTAALAAAPGVSVAAPAVEVPKA